MLRLIAFGFVALFAAAPAFAHGGHEHRPAASWTLDPWITVPLALALLLFLIGRRRLGQRSRIDRKGSGLFIGGWLVLTLSLVSPLHEGGERSFTLHMIEHELIMLVATLLLAASHSGGTLAWGLPHMARRLLGGSWKAPLAAFWKRATDPITATIAQAIVMWAWHAPALFNLALEHEGWHAAQHLSFFLSSLLFWSAMLGRRGGYPLAAGCLFVTSLIEGALGALMALSQSPWYAAYAAMGMSGIGLDPVVDQQLAGLVMWIPGGAVHGAAALLLLYRWLAQEGRGPPLGASTRYR